MGVGGMGEWPTKVLFVFRSIVEDGERGATAISTENGTWAQRTGRQLFFNLGFDVKESCVALRQETRFFIS